MDIEGETSAPGQVLYEHVLISSAFIHLHNIIFENKACVYALGDRIYLQSSHTHRQSYCIYSIGNIYSIQSHHCGIAYFQIKIHHHGIIIVLLCNFKKMCGFEL